MPPDTAPSLPIRLGELARVLSVELEGDAETPIHGISTLAEAGPGDLSFVTDARYGPAAAATQAGALLVGREFAPAATPSPPLLRCDEPQLALARALALLRPPAPRPALGIHPLACVDASAEIGRGASIGPFAVVGAHCHLGENAVLHPHVVLYANVVAGRNFVAHAHAVVREGTRIGDEVILQPGVVIGGDGFGFARQADGRHAKIPQTGSVEIGDRVEIQANSCVDRAVLGATVIGAGSKIDNLAQVAHNCRLGENVIVCAQVGMAGSTNIGDGALLAGQVGVAGHCTIGPGAIITAQSGTHGDLEAGGVYSGSPAFDHRQWLRSTAAFAKLGELHRMVRDLARAVGRLQDGTKH
ncbi:MAG: UDP-3-O-(3-hydroxymyristoyl)glucosamine N-acyltransferase [Terriglobales bacterium]